MVEFRLENLNFSYANSDKMIIKNVSLDVNHGDFVVLCGQSASGKTTLLKLLKPELSPKGKLSGNIFFEGKKLEDLSLRQTASEIGFVQQNPEYQIVTHTAQAELSFILENLGFDSSTIRVRIAEMAAYFSMNSWLEKNVNELSGGQKQLLSLASVLICYPKVLILDEPTSQLDPMASEIFIDTLRKINQDYAITIIMTEHRLENVLPICSKVVVLGGGKIAYDGKVKDVFDSKNQIEYILNYLPTPMRVYHSVNSKLNCPITINEGRRWLEAFLGDKTINQQEIKNQELETKSEIAIEIKNLFYAYPQAKNYVIDNLSLKLESGKFHAILGSNAVGKTTLVKLMTGMLNAKSGKIKIFGKKITSYKATQLYDEMISVLPQNIETLFSQETVEQQLMYQLEGKQISKDEKIQLINEVATQLGILEIFDHHPYDISGGQMQKVGLALVLLQKPKIIVLDEPTKGMDVEFKIELAKILDEIKHSGKTIVMISHDTEFCASYCDTCSLVFDGKIALKSSTRKFFSDNFFFSTSAKKMTRKIFDDCITCQEVISLCQKNL